MNNAIRILSKIFRVIKGEWQCYDEVKKSLITYSANLTGLSSLAFSFDTVGWMSGCHPGCKK